MPSLAGLFSQNVAGWPLAGLRPTARNQQERNFPALKPKPLPCCTKLANPCCAAARKSDGSNPLWRVEVCWLAAIVARA
eukprot:6490657-Amphidinium_carterae.1